MYTDPYARDLSQQSHTTPQPNRLGVYDKPEKKEYSFAETAMDVGASILSSPLGLINDIVGFAGDAIEWVGHATKLMDDSTNLEWEVVPEFGKKTTAGKIVGEISEFGLGFALTGALSSLSLIKNASMVQKVHAFGETGKWAKAGVTALGATAKGAVVDAVLTDTDEERISDVLAQLPATAKLPFVQYLKTNVNDSDFEIRMKGALEGAAIGLPLDVATAGLARLGKAIKHSIFTQAQKEGTEVAQATLTRIVGEEVGPEAVGKVSRSVDADIELANSKYEKVYKTEDHVGGLVKSMFKAKTDEEKDAIAYRIIDNFAEYSDDDLMDELANRAFNSKYVTEDVAGTFDMIRSISRVRKIPPQTHEQTIAQVNKFAEDFGMDITYLKKLVDTAEDMPMQITFWRKYLQQSGEQLTEMASKILDDPTSVDWLQFQEAAVNHDLIQPMIERLRAASGRTLNSFKIHLDDVGAAINVNRINKELLDDSPSSLKRKLTAMKDEQVNEKAMRKLAVAVLEAGATSPKVMRETVRRGLTGNKYLNFMKHARYMNMLSGMSTQVINNLGNAYSLFVREIGEPMGAAVIGAVKQDPDRVLFREVGDNAAVIFTSAMDWMKLSLWDTPKELGDDNWFKGITQLLTSHDAREQSVRKLSVDPLEKLAHEGAPQLAVDAGYMGIRDDTTIGAILGKVINGYKEVGSLVSTDQLALSDAGWKHMAYKTNSNRLMKRYMRNNDISGDEAISVHNALSKRLSVLRETGNLPAAKNATDRQMNNLAREIHDLSIKEAKAVTFQTELEGFQRGFYRLLNSDNTTSKLVSTMVMPFVKTPLNLINFVTERTPVLYKASREAREAMAAGGIARAEQQAKLLHGSLLYMFGVGLATSGKLTGSFKHQERDKLQAAGLQEHSVKIGGKWVSYSRSDPLGYFLGLAADLVTIADLADAEEFEEAAAHAIFGFGQTIASKSYLKGVGDLYNAITSPEQYSEAYLAGILQSFVPLVGAQKTFNALTDPHLRDTQSVVDKIKSSVIGGSRANMVKTDAFGEEIEKSWLGVVMGINVRDDKNNAALNELASLRAFPVDREGRFMNTKMTREEHNKAKQYLKELNVRDRMDQLVASEAYQKASAPNRKKMLQRQIDSLRRVSRQILYNNDPEFRQRVAEEQHKRISKLIAPPDGVLEAGTSNLARKIVHGQDV